jgi:hypothetical protein
MLRGIRRTFSMKLGQRLFVCLSNQQLPPELRKRIRPVVLAGVACWMDRITSKNRTA